MSTETRKKGGGARSVLAHVSIYIAALVFASPLMYQVLAATASLARKLIDEIDAFVIAGHVKSDVIQSLVELYEQIERESLTAMQVATEGHETVANGLKRGLKS